MAAVWVHHHGCADAEGCAAAGLPPLGSGSSLSALVAASACDPGLRLWSVILSYRSLHATARTRVWSRISFSICLTALSVALLTADCLSLPVPLNVLPITACPARRA